MARFMVKASEYKNVCKAVNDRKLAELKKEIIEILKQQDEKEFKKAVDLFESQEMHYSHLEKSITGKWVEKAGYGVGTVRIWKGKKYKKIAPGKWARVFDKEGRGTNIAIGKLIAKVQKIDNVEDLMALVMANKQRFVDENGVDLPVLDKLRAVVDARNGNIGSKEIKEESVERQNTRKKYKELNRKFDKIAPKMKAMIKKYGVVGSSLGQILFEKERDFYDEVMRILEGDSNIFNKYTERLALENGSKETKDEKAELKRNPYSIREMSRSLNFNELIPEYEKQKKILNWDINKKKKEIERNYDFSDFSEEEKNKFLEPKFIDLENQYQAASDNIEYIKNELKRAMERDGVNDVIEKMKKHGIFDEVMGTSKPAEKEPETKDKLSDDAEIVLLNLKDWNKDEAQSILSKKINSKDDKNIDAYKEAYSYLNTHNMPTFKNGKIIDKESEEESNKEKFPGKTLDAKKKELKKLKSRLSDLKSKDIELTHRSQGNWGDGMRLSKLPSNKAWENNRERMDGVKAKIDILEKEIYDEEHKPYWIQDIKGNRLTNEDAKEKIKANLKKIDELSKSDEARKAIKIQDMKNENDYLMERLNQNDKRDMEIEAKFYESEQSEAEKHQNRSDAMKGNKNAVKVGGDKKVIGIFTKKDDNSVEMDATKENKVIFDSLNKALSKDKTRAFMTDIYYDGEYLNSTNGYSLVSVKVGDIGLNKGFVKVDYNNGKINVSAIPDKHSDYIPPYKTVIPENNNQEVNIDNKKLKEKLKAMKAEGAYTKDNPIIALEFKDGNVVLDDTIIGKSDAKFADDKNAIYFVADNLSNMIINNKDSTMFVSDNPEKAIAFSDDSSDIVLMPAKETILNYEGRRNIKKEKDEYEANAKQKAQDAMNSIVDTQKDSMSNEWVQSLIDKVNNKEMENHKTIIEHAYKALKDAEKMIEKPTKKWTSSLANNKYGYSLLAAVRKNPEFKTALENMAMEYGLIKKSLFDDFIVDVFATDDEEEIEDELYEGETEYNDYSAEQPELFNSTAMKVREAMDRIRNQVL